MNLLLKFLLLVNVLRSDANYVPEQCIKDQNATEDTPHFRIFHGTPANAKQFPYQVSMKMRSRVRFYTFCGGTIIAPSKILSAAHCFFNTKSSLLCCSSGKPSPRPVSRFYAVAGTLTNKDVEKNMKAGPAQWRKIKRTVAPNDYEFPRRDIALVFTSKPFTYDDYVNQIPYALEHQSYVGLECIASGYGQTETRRPSEVLLWAKLDILTTTKCSRLHNNNMNRFVCTSGAVTDVGKGDSGGPLVCKGTKHSNEGASGILVGVTSGKREFTRKRDRRRTSNAFFTRVSSYKKFIQNNKAQIIMPDFILCISAFCFSLEVPSFGLHRRRFLVG